MENVCCNDNTAVNPVLDAFGRINENMEPRGNPFHSKQKGIAAEAQIRKWSIYVAQ